MFLLDEKEELTVAKIHDILGKFNTAERPKLQRWYDYYLGKQDILRKQASNQYKPCNKIVANYCNSITTTYGGYLTGKEITYSSDKDISEIRHILDYNDVSAEDALYLRNALIYGVAYEMVYIDPDGKQRMAVLDSRECIPIYTNTVTDDLRAIIRYYIVSEIGNYADLNKTKYYVEVYENHKTRRYLSDAMFSSLEFIEELPNYYGQVPITVFALNEERESIFNKVMGLQDAYNTLISSSVDDFEAFADAYMTLSGMTVDDETVTMMKENRILLLPDGGKAEYLTKDIKTTQIENLLDRLDEKIHTISHAPNFTDDAFGTASGIAMQYKLLGFEDAAGTIEKSMTKALQRRIELFCAMLQLTGGDEMWRDVIITFHRNLPIDLSNIVTMVSGLKDIVSTKTLLAQLPFIVDVDKELLLVKQEKEENKMANPFLQATLNYQTAAQQRENQDNNEEK